MSFSSCRRRRCPVRRVETLETRSLLAITFGPVEPILDSDAVYPKTVIAADLDGDRDMDLAVASLGDDKIFWYENTDGLGTYGPQRLVSTQAIAATRVVAADLDGDGDLDLLSSSAGVYDSDLSWYENMDGRGTFGMQNLITADVQLPDSIAVADMDGDGDLDVLSASRSDDKIAWYENTDRLGSFGPQQIISDQLDGATTVAVADFDQDGDMDVAAGAANANTIVWFENDGSLQFTEHLITDRAIFVTELKLADIDNDGDTDIVSTSREDDTVGWYPFDSQRGEFDPERVVSIDENGPNALYLADMDNNGLLDVLVASRAGDRTVLIPQASPGIFEAAIVLSDETSGASSVIAFDMDSDGDLDVASTSRFDNKLAIYEHFSGPAQHDMLQFGPPNILTRIGAPSVQSATTADLDGDGDLDVLSAVFGVDHFVWNENRNGTFGPDQLISDRAEGTETAIGADIDGDGDQDVVTASYFDDKLAWHENLDGKGSFGPQRVVTGDITGPEDVVANDVDGDGDLDLLSVSRDNNMVVWFENLDSRGVFGPSRLISDTQLQPTTVRTADIDGDGDVDVLVNAYDPNDSSIAWYENLDGQGNFSEERTITVLVNIATATAAGDFDGDGDIDIVSVSGGDNKVAWYDNTDGAGTFGEQRIISGANSGVFDVQLGDLDGDGDLDIATASLLGDAIVVYENLGGGTFSQPIVAISDVRAPTSIEIADVNQDGLPDLVTGLSLDDAVVWLPNQSPGTAGRGDFNEDGQVDEQDIELLCAQVRDAGLDRRFDLTGDGAINRSDVNELITDVLGTSFGDANLDGIFNSTDLIQVFQRGEYEDGEAFNSSWGEGDWNCDGDFSTTDLVFAFQAAGFIAA